MERVDDTSARKEPVRDGAAAVSAPKLDSVALARLAEEVRVGEETRPNAYNRTYHRHNR
jgi:hypothetical protein